MFLYPQTEFVNPPLVFGHKIENVGKLDSRSPMPS